MALTLAASLSGAYNDHSRNYTTPLWARCEEPAGPEMFTKSAEKRVPRALYAVIWVGVYIVAEKNVCTWISFSPASLFFSLLLKITSIINNLWCYFLVYWQMLDNKMNAFPLLHPLPQQTLLGQFESQRGKVSCCLVQTWAIIFSLGAGIFSFLPRCIVTQFVTAYIYYFCKQFETELHWIRPLDQ